MADDTTNPIDTKDPTNPTNPTKPTDPTDPAFMPKVVSNQAQISFDQFRGPLKSNIAYVNLIKKYPIMKITKTADVKYAAPGDIVVFTIKIMNIGTAAATNVWFSDKIPDEFTIRALFVSANSPTPRANGNNVIWNFGTVTPGTKITIVITCSVN